MRSTILFLMLTMAAGGLAQTICIDPGHPSENGLGSKGKSLTEVAAAWKVGLRLKSLLEADGYRVMMTKSAERQRVTNRKRAEIANEAGASLFLRLHCDAAAGSGIGVYYPDKPGQSGGVSGPSKEVRSRSRSLAKLFHPALVAALKGKHPDRGLHTDRQTAIGRRQGALTGSIHAKVPVLLVELAVLTNPRDERFLASKGGQEAICQALRKAVRAACPLREALSSSAR